MTRTQEYIQSIRDLHKHLTMYIALGEALVGERSAYNSGRINFPLISLTPDEVTHLTRADEMLMLYKSTDDDTLIPRLYVSTTDATISTEFSTDIKRVPLTDEYTANVSKIRSAFVGHNYSMRSKYSSKDSELYINFHKRHDIDLMLSVPYNTFIKPTLDDIFQYCIIVPEFEMLRDIFCVLMEYNMYMKCELDDIEKYNLGMKRACQKIGFI